MPLNLNVAPYYDDFDETKQYHRMLFKPGYAVQGRELTQLQTVLQNQIERFGNHVFKNGAIVSGCPVTLDIKLNYIKILDTDTEDNTISNSNLSNYIGVTLEGSESGIQAIVLDVATGSVDTPPDFKTLFLRYTTGDGAVGSHFRSGETLTVVSEGEYLNDTFIVDDTAPGNDVLVSDVYFGLGCRISVGDGIIYADGKFIYHKAQTLLLSKYISNPTCLVGFKLVESFVDSEDDETLLDPAQGTYNFAAPGADRYKINTQLVKYNTGDTIDKSFFLLYQIVEGVVAVKQQDDIYAKLGDNLATRTFEESGNYTVRSYPIAIKEHLLLQDDNGVTNGGLIGYNTTTPTKGGSADKIAIGIEPGTSYVKGYRYSHAVTQWVPVDKGLDEVRIESLPISTAYGNYILVDDLAGIWDLTEGSLVYLCEDAFNGISGGNYSNTTAPTADKILGTARVRQIVYGSGTIGTSAAQYRLYLYDIKIPRGTFADVQGIYFEDGDAPAFADIVTDATLQEQNYPTYLFPIPVKATKSLETDEGFQNSFIYTKSFDVTINTSAEFNITLSGDETFPFPNGVINDSNLNSNFFLVLKHTDGAGVKLNTVTKYKGQYIDLTAAGITVTQNSSQSITFNFTSNTNTANATRTTAAQLYVNVQSASSHPLSKELRRSRLVKIDMTNMVMEDKTTLNLGIADIYRVKGIYVDTNYPTDLNNLPTNYVNEFTVDNGQRDTFYDHGSITLKSTSNLDIVNKKILVVLDYFAHNSTSATASYFSIDSYPIDDTGTSPETTIFTYNVPIYVAQNGKSYDLRDTLDFRPRMTDTAANATTLGGATVNPSSETSFATFGFGITNPVPSEQFNTDLIYYLGRQIRVVIDDTGNFRTIDGTPSLKPVLPFEPVNAMSIAVINIPPYPSLSPQMTKLTGRADYGVTFKTIDNRRYTMRDIGTLDQRISQLEYYTSLSLLEKAASDLTIPSDTGLDRFKNGILVDAFTGHNIGNVFDTNYHCSIDPTQRELRPFYYLENSPLQLNFEASKGVKITGQVATLPYTHTILTQSKFASQSINCTSDLLFTYNGDMVLDPEVDNWVDTTRRPDVQSNYDGNYDNWENLKDAWGTQWNSWSSVWTGTPKQTETIPTALPSQTIQNNPRTGIIANCLPESRTTNMGDRVVDMSLIPFMRSIVVTFKATRLKPNTRVYPFFDGIDVSKYCRQLDSSVRDFLPINTDDYSHSIPVLSEYTNQQNVTRYTPTYSENTGFMEGEYYPNGTPDKVWGESLITDADGVVCGQFRIPEKTFRIGTKMLRLVDDRLNRPAFVTTTAHSNFSALGFSQITEGTIVSTRPPVIIIDGGGSQPPTEPTTPRNPVPPPPSNPPSGSTPQTPPAPTTNNSDAEVEDPFNGKEWIYFGNDDLKAGNYGWKMWDDWVAAGSPMDANSRPLTPQEASDRSSNPGEYTTPDVNTNYESAGDWVNDPVIETQTVDFTDNNVENEYDSAYDYSTEEDTTNVYDSSPAAYSYDYNYGGYGSYCGWEDPLAQTFVVQNKPYGVFVTKLDLYFRTKGTNAVTVQIREVVNGYPSRTVVPFGQATVLAGDIRVSTEDENNAVSFSPTTFYFQSPVYLMNDTEYCFVVMPGGNDPDYTMWISQLGENQIGTTTRISEQSNVGVLFTSANNSTWTAHQDKDIMFGLYQATFTPNAKGTVYLENAPIDYLKFTYSGYSDGYFVSGDRVHSFTINITNSGTGYTLPPIVTISGGGEGVNATAVSEISGGEVVAITVTDPGSNFTSNPTITITPAEGDITGADAEASITLNFGTVTEYQQLYHVAKVLVRTGQFTTGDVIGNGRSYNTIDAIQNKVVNAVHTNIGMMDLKSTTTNWYSAFTESTAVSANTTFTNFPFDMNVELEKECAIFSYSNELETLSGEKSFRIKSEIVTQNSDVSPVVDLRKLGMICIKNDVNNDSTNETTNTGAAVSKYISRRVVLEDGLDAEDLKVFLTIQKPSITNIKVYARLQHANDERLFDNVEWIELETTTQPLSTVTTTTGSTGIVPYQEFGFDIPDAYKNDGIFEYAVPRITGFTISDDGSGYVTAPIVTISGGGGSGATAIAKISGGNVSEIILTNPGIGYTSAPTVTIEGNATADAVFEDITYSTYKSFAIKIVPLSANTSVVPKVKELRAIALQK